MGNEISTINIAIRDAPRYMLAFFMARNYSTAKDNKKDFY